MDLSSTWATVRPTSQVDLMQAVVEPFKDTPVTGGRAHEVDLDLIRNTIPGLTHLLPASDSFYRRGGS